MEPKSRNNSFDFEMFFNMRMESLKDLECKTPSWFLKLIRHYDLLVHGQSERYRLMVMGDETKAQIRYQAELLKSIRESEEEGKGKGKSKSKGGDDDEDGDRSDAPDGEGVGGSGVQRS